MDLFSPPPAATPISAGGASDPLLTGENDSENEHAPSPTDVFAAEPYEEGSPKKKQRVA